MALATVEDVRRMLKIAESSVDDERDRQLASSLEAAESWVHVRLRQRFDQETGDTYSVYDHRETDEILLPRIGCVVTAVRIALGDELSEVPTNDSTTLTTDQYDVIDGMNGARAIRLRAGLLYQPFEGATAERMPRVYRKVEIDWEPPTGDLVPAAVRDATALLAAGMWKAAPRLAGGMKSEKIGDYSYTLDDLRGEEGSDYWSQAMRMLRPFIRRKPMVT